MTIARGMPLGSRQLRLWASVGLVFGIWSLHNALLLPMEEKWLEPSLREPLVIGLRVLVWLPLFGLHLMRYESRRWLEALGLSTPLRLRNTLWVFVVGISYLVATRLLVRIAAGAPAQTASLATVFFSFHMLGVWVVVLLEELVLRGFLLGQMLLDMRARRAVLLTALLYASLHLPGWVARDGWHIGLIVSSLVIFLLGVLLGWARVASGSLYPALLLHFANNALAIWLGG